MKPSPLEIDPFANDPGRWGASLSTLGEVVLACLDAARPASIVEVGAYAGDVTRLLLDWAGPAGAHVVAVDPSPHEVLVQLERERPELDLVRATSLDALPEIEPPDAVVIDGDHNYYTVSEELRLIAERSPEGGLPLLLFHDVSWPHARRDDYFDPELIPEDYRQPFVPGAGLFPGEPGVHPGSLPFRYAAEREGGPRNGVLTAVEDFVAARDGVQLAVVPAFFGLGVAWRSDAPYAGALAEVIERWDGDPVLERLEANRVFHLASVHCQMVRASELSRRNARLEEMLNGLLKSRAFSLAERISKLRGGGDPLISKDLIRRALSD